jgi:nucleotide-binding universal stress UspA family protein
VEVADVTRPQHTPTIVVGLDHNRPNDGAVLSAALEQARHTGSALHVVHAIAPDATTGPAPFDAAAVRARLATRQDRQKAIVDDLRSRLRTITDDLGERLTVDYSVRHGDPATVLLWAAQHADLIVVGTRSTRHGSPLLLGMVSQDVAVHATCPVLLIPAP